MSHEPKDFRLGRRAYEAFYDEQPQVWFEDLAHHAQMRWVRAARAVTVEANKKAADPDKLAEAQAVIDAAPKRGLRIDYKGMKSEAERKAVRSAAHYMAVHRRKDK